jgi:hypothetical protein
MNTQTIESAVEEARGYVKANAKGLLDLKATIAATEAIEGEDRGEVMANITLAYRHLEDAAMRLGKVLQARNGGVSIYDKPKA